MAVRKHYPPPASMAPEPSIWHRRRALDKKRREAAREAMAAFDVEHHKAMAALREECGAIKGAAGRPTPPGHGK